MPVAGLLFALRRRFPFVSVQLRAASTRLSALFRQRLEAFRRLAPRSFRLSEGRRQLAPRRIAQKAGEGGDQPRQHRLRLGVAETHVELHHFHALGGQCQTAVEHADEGRSAPRHFVHDGLGDLGRDGVGQPRVGPRERRVGSHAAGVGPLAAVERPLVVLRGLQRKGDAPVAQAEKRDLGAVEEFLDQRLPLGFGQARPGVGEGGVSVVRHDDPLARGQPVVFDYVGRAESVEGSFHFSQTRAQPRPRRRHARTGHDLLGERLRAFQACRFPRRAENVDARLAHGVGHARDQRSLRTDDDEVDPLAASECSHGRTVEDVEVDKRSQRGHPGVPRGDVEDVVVTAKRTGDGVLAASRPEYEYVHGTTLSQVARQRRFDAGRVTF